MRRSLMAALAMVGFFAALATADSMLAAPRFSCGSGCYNVMAYGANGEPDGQDDYCALYRAFRDAELAGGGTVFLPAGTFHVKAGSSSTSGSSVIGSGRWPRTGDECLRPTERAVLFEWPVPLSPVDRSPSDPTRGSNIRLVGEWAVNASPEHHLTTLILDTVDIDDARPIGLLINGGQDGPGVKSVAVEDLIVRGAVDSDDAPHDLILLRGKVSDSLFSRLWLLYARHTALRYLPRPGAVGSVVERSRITDINSPNMTDIAGGGIQGGVPDMQIIDNYFETGQNGDYPDGRHHAIYGGGPNTVVLDNTFTGVSSDLKLTSGAPGFEVADNRFENVLFGVMLTGGPGVVRGNEFINSPISFHGDFVDIVQNRFVTSEPDPDYVAKWGVEVVAANPRQFIVGASNSSHLRIEDNSFVVARDEVSPNPDSAIYISSAAGDNWTVRGNRFSGPLSSAVRIDGGRNHLITDNSVSTTVAPTRAFQIISLSASGDPESYGHMITGNLIVGHQWLRSIWDDRFGADCIGGNYIVGGGRVGSSYAGAMEANYEACTQ